MKYLATSFDKNYEVRGVFFEISKVCKEEIIHKLQCLLNDRS